MIGIAAATVASACIDTRPAQAVLGGAPLLSARTAADAPPSRNPKRAAQPRPSAPETRWSLEQIAKGRARCLELLSGLKAQYDVIAPFRKGRCGSPAPVLLKSIGEAPAVRISPPARINCPMVAALDKWLKAHVQPSAKSLLDSPVTEINNMASYACRNRNHAKNGRLSEHGKANALDIGAFRLASGTRVSVLKDWGAVERDLLALARREFAAERARATISAAQDTPSRKTSAPRAPREATGQRTKRKAPQPLRKRAATANQAAPDRSTRTTTLQVSPEQGVKLAELQLKVARARLDLAEREGALTQQSARVQGLRQDLKAMLAKPLDIDLERRDRRSGRRTAPDNLPAVTAPRQNPGRTAIDRARREVERKKAQLEAREAAERRRQQRIAQAQRRREREARGTRRRLRRAERTLERRQRQVRSAVDTLQKAERDLKAFIDQLQASSGTGANGSDRSALPAAGGDRARTRLPDARGRPTIERTAGTAPQALAQTGAGTLGALLDATHSHDQPHRHPHRRTHGHTHAAPAPASVATRTASARPSGQGGTNGAQTGAKARADAEAMSLEAIMRASPRVSGVIKAQRAGQRTAKARFLRSVHAGACQVFGTVLGPDADDPHRNHFHFDLAPRRRSAYCR